MWIRTETRLLNAAHVEEIEVADAGRDGHCKVTADGIPLAILPTRVEALRLLDAIERAIAAELPLMDLREEMRT